MIWREMFLLLVFLVSGDGVAFVIKFRCFNKLFDQNIIQTYYLGPTIIKPIFKSNLYL